MRNGKPKPTATPGSRARDRARDELDDDDLDLFVFLDAQPDRVYVTDLPLAWAALVRAGAVSVTEIGGDTWVQAIVPPEVLGL